MHSQYYASSLESSREGMSDTLMSRSPGFFVKDFHHSMSVAQQSSHWLKVTTLLPHAAVVVMQHTSSVAWPLLMKPTYSVLLVLLPKGRWSLLVKTLCAGRCSFPAVYFVLSREIQSNKGGPVQGDRSADFINFAALPSFAASIKHNCDWINVSQHIILKSAGGVPQCNIREKIDRESPSPPPHKPAHVSLHTVSFTSYEN